MIKDVPRKTSGGSRYVGGDNYTAGGLGALCLEIIFLLALRMLLPKKVSSPEKNMKFLVKM